MSGSDPKPTTSDAELIESARSGDTSAFAELWRRHFRPAARVARQFTSIDADDLVSEAYARIFQRVLAGGGPTGAFRPYLYTTIRNLASTWGAASRDIQVDMIEDFVFDEASLLGTVEVEQNLRLEMAKAAARALVLKLETIDFSKYRTRAGKT